MAENTFSADRFRQANEPKRVHTFEEELYDEDGHLTAEGAQKAIKAGHSVLVGTVIVSHPGHPLISEANLAKGSERRLAVARANLLEQQKAIEAQLASLGSNTPEIVVGHVEHPDLVAPEGGPGQGDTAGLAPVSKAGDTSKGKGKEEKEGDAK